jgi:hypothetical protein
LTQHVAAGITTTMRKAEVKHSMGYALGWDDLIDPKP